MSPLIYSQDKRQQRQNQYNLIQVHTTMEDLTKYQKRQLRILAKEVRAVARVIDVCSDADIKYTLHSLAIDLKTLKKEVATLEELAINIAFEAVHNNQKQEA